MLLEKNKCSCVAVRETQELCHTMAWFELLGRGVGRVVSRWRRLRGRTSGRTLLQMGVVLLGPGLGRRTGRRHRSLLELGEPPWLSLIDYGLSMRGRQALVWSPTLLMNTHFTSSISVMLNTAKLQTMIQSIRSKGWVWKSCCKIGTYKGRRSTKKPMSTLTTRYGLENMLYCHIFALRFLHENT